MGCSSGQTIVTAADRRYERTLWQMLRSAERGAYHIAHRFVAFDLGMTPIVRERLRSRFSWCRIEPFDFQGVPAHVRRLVSCAWKPIAIEDVLRQEEGLVLWLDSATLFHGTLAPIFERIARDGVFTLVGQSALTCWCHPDTLRWLPLAIDPMARVYHAAYKRLDRIVLGARQPQLMSSRIGPRADPRQRSSP